MLTDDDDVHVDGQVVLFAVFVSRRYAAISPRVAMSNRSEDEQSLVIVGVPFAKTERKYAAMPKSNGKSLGERKVQSVSK